MRSVRRPARADSLYHARIESRRSGSRLVFPTAARHPHRRRTARAVATPSPEDRSAVFESGGRGFESLRARHNLSRSLKWQKRLRVTPGVTAGKIFREGD